MHFRSVVSFLILSVVAAQFCEKETEYLKDSECCKKCGPGTRMRKDSNCGDPSCVKCKEGEYQDAYTKEEKCMRQPTCDRNLNLQPSTPSTTQKIECECFPGHHCADDICNSCVMNTVCKAGEKISQPATKKTDTVCEPCANETFSDKDSASTCKPWTTCLSGQKEEFPGSFTSDRTCKALKNGYGMAVVSVVFVLLVFVGLGVVVYYCHKNGKIEKISRVQKLLRCQTWCIKNTHQADVLPDVEQPAPPQNQPQEDTEDLIKLNGSLTPGISENGMPVSQDHSKSLLLSQSDTEQEISVRL